MRHSISLQFLKGCLDQTVWLCIRAYNEHTKKPNLGLQNRGRWDFNFACEYWEKCSCPWPCPSHMSHAACTACLEPAWLIISASPEHPWPAASSFVKFYTSGLLCEKGLVYHNLPSFICIWCVNPTDSSKIINCFHSLAIFK